LHYARHGAGLTGAWHQTGFLTDVAVRLLEERRDAGAAVELRRHHLRAAPNLSSFTALRRTATSAGSWPAERIDALDVLLAHNPDDWLRALLADGDPDLAWEASRSMEVPRSLRLQLVRARAQTHPDQVHDDYVAIIDDTLTDARPDNYREAVKLLGELRRASEVGRRVEEYDAYVAILIERHRPRPTLVEKLAAMPPARPA
jgi:uncharacterized Zn finger protein